MFNYLDYFINRGDDVTIVCARIGKGVTLPSQVKVVRLNVRFIIKPFRPKWFNKRVKNYLSKEHFDFSLSLGRTEGQDAVLAAATHKGYLKHLNQSGLSFSDAMQINLDESSFESSKVIFACSEMVKKEIEDYYEIPSTKIKVLYPPFNPKKFDSSLKQQKFEIREKLGFKRDQKIFIFVSTGHKRKGLDLLIRVFSILDPEKYILLISGTPRVNSLRKNIQDIGYNQSLDTWYALSDFLIHPALYEPYGQIITEALYMKTPVLISDHVGAKELITEKEGMILPSTEMRKWFHAIQEVNPEDFDVSDDFVERNELSLINHMEKMLSALNLKTN